MAKRFRGITKAQESKPADAVRDIRSVWSKLNDALCSRTGSVVLCAICIVLMIIFPPVDDWLMLAFIFIFWYSFWQFQSLPFKLPLFANKLDRNDRAPGSNKPKKARGIFFFGNDIVTKEQLWFNNEDMRTHVLMFGSTGAGKTEALLSLSYNALVQGSGFIYVDGKGDNSLFAKVFSMVRSMGREDDLLVVNFMTGGSDIIGPQSRILSNTMNPFALGSSSMLSNLVVSLMDSGSSGSSDGDMWKGRAISFIEALMKPLTWLRDEGYLLLEAGVIRRYFTLDVLEELLYDKKVIDQHNNVTIMEKAIPYEVRDPLENYLSTLPGYKKSEKGKQSGKAYEQHGYITMQLTRIFGSLADVYGHIIRTQLAEVDFNDVVLNRRILVVLLPALEKSPDELANLGKLIIASLKSMLAAGLGQHVEGEYADVIETKPTTSKIPFLCVLDEYGYYAVKGFAVVPAQARSLGFSVIFAGQDLPAFQKASKEEAASICANTNIKICMKLEDPLETWDFFNKTAGETYVSVARSFNRSGDGFSAFNYKDSNEASIDKRARLDLMDLKDQGMGEMHVFFQSDIIRAEVFFANPPKVKKIKLNQFVKVQGISDQAYRFLRKLNNIQVPEELMHPQPMEGFITLVDLFRDYAEQHKDLDKLNSKLINFMAGNQDEETIDFGDQSENDSIFMSMPVEMRLASEYFDVEISNLQDSLLTKDKLYEVIKKISIIEGKSVSVAKDLSNQVIDLLEKETGYYSCYPKREESLVNLVEDFLNKVVKK
jgi:intracellular multiplication protein IcmO